MAVLSLVARAVRQLVPELLHPAIPHLRVLPRTCARRGEGSDVPGTVRREKEKRRERSCSPAERERERMVVWRGARGWARE